jgi:LruC domain-containing protein
MKKIYHTLWVIFICLASGPAFSQVPSPPMLSVSISGPSASLSWTTVTGADGYTLYYAPSPYTGPGSISSINLGTRTGIDVDLWDGASFFIALKSRTGGVESGFSNIEMVQIATASASISDLQVQDDFDFSTTKNVSIFVETPFPNIVIKVLDGMPEEIDGNGNTITNPDAKELLKFVTDGNGSFSISDFAIHAYLTTLVFETITIGLPTHIRVPVINNTVSLDYSDSSTFLSQLGKKPAYLSKFLRFLQLLDFTGLIFPADAWAQEPFGDYFYLGQGEGDWDASGVPVYLEPDRDLVSTDLFTHINLSLPESQQLPDHHLEYLYDALGNTPQTNVSLNEDGHVFVTFIHEGAGYKNVLGYYYYGTNGIPTPATVGEVENRTIIFPNVSYAGSGGGLISGDKVRLEGPNPDGSFPAGTTIGWFVLANGYKAFPQTVTAGNWALYSDRHLNPEIPPDQDLENIRQHVVLLYDATEQMFVLGFEDIRRDNQNCDNDFNDAIFSVVSTPATAIDTTDVAEIETQAFLDSDGDGIFNDSDDFDNDASRAFNNVSSGTLAFEDLWPKKGDYDFNDLVMAYAVNRITNAANQVVQIDGDFTIRAVGAWYRNAFAIELPIDPSVILSVTGTQTSLTTDIFSYLPNGLEAGQEGLATNPEALYDDDKSVFIVAEDVTEFMTPGGIGFINTKDTGVYVVPKTISMTITLDPDSLPSLSEVGSPPWNPFMVINVTNIRNNPDYTPYIIRAKEVHMADYPPTNKADWNLHFGAGDDTNILPYHPGGPRHYKTVNNLPWVLHIPETFDYPLERIDISNGYLKFVNWAETGGAQDSDWFKDLDGNRNPVYLFQRP